MKRLIFLMLALLVAGSASAATKVQVMTGGVIDVDRLPTISFFQEADPPSPALGQVWWNNATNQLKVAGASGVYAFNSTSLVGWDTTPEAFSFTDVTNATTSTVYTSAPITVSGINWPAAISVSGDASAKYSVNNATATAANGTVASGDEVRAVVTSSASDATAANATVTIGGVSDAYVVTTAASESVTYLVDEDFEGTGTPSGWLTYGSPNFDYTTTVLEGSQSISFGDSEAVATKSFDAKSAIYVTFLFNVESGSAVDVDTFRIRSGATAIAFLKIRNTSGTLGLRLKAGTVETSLNQTLSAATTYRAWIAYNSSTKDMTLWVGDPSASRPEDALLTVTGNTSESSVDTVSFMSHGDSDGVRTMDVIVVSNTEFTDVP